MRRLESSCNTCAGVAAGVHHVLAIMVLGLVEEGLDAGLCERPGAGIERLFLAPNNGLGIWIHVKVLLQLLPWEGVKLLNARNGRVGEFVFGPVLMQCDVYLAGTEDDAVDILRVSNGIAVFRVRDDPSEVGIASEFFDGGATERMSKKRFREEYDQG
jgi:hypothetical protein